MGTPLLEVARAANHPTPDPVDELVRRAAELADRVDRVVRCAGHDLAGDGAPAISEHLTATVVDVAETLTDHADDPEVVARCGRVLEDLRAVQAVLRERGADEDARAYGHIDEALQGLRATASSRALIRAAPAELCSACGFDRAMVSRVRGSMWLPHLVHIATDPAHPANVALARFAETAEIPLSDSQLEAEMVRRRVPALILDPGDDDRAFRPVVELSQSAGYVVAPIVTSSGVVGFVHGDTFSSGRRLTIDDRDHIQAFVDGLSLDFERLVLHERLAAQHQYVRSITQDVDRALGALATPPVGLVVDDGLAHGSPGTGTSPCLDRLTARELEVLRLLAEGATNQQIADTMVVAISTIKSHVKHIMRKLDARTRSEAVARYFSLTAPRRRAA